MAPRLGACLLLTVSAASGLSRLPRRAVLAAPLLAVQSPACSAVTATAVAAPARVRLSSVKVDVAGLSVPVAVWAPVASLPIGEITETYAYTISVGRIASRLGVRWLSWLPSRSFDLPPAGVADDRAFPRTARPGDALIFAHGFLGSPYDMAHICEALAAAGFIVAAPEMPESLAASYAGAITRGEIVSATRRMVDATGTGGRWGIFGHSAGGGTALRHPGHFPLGRAAIAAGLASGTQNGDPLFVVASDGDGCSRMMRARGASMAEQLAAAAAAGVPATIFSTADAAYASTAAPPPVGALLYLDAQAGLLPNHISFLWRGTNEAMFEVLAPLLPLARALNLFLLDFDVEIVSRLAEPTAKQLTPALCRFFGTHAARAEAER
jgi:dienelactone hydrolase